VVVVVRVAKAAEWAREKGKVVVRDRAEVRGKAPAWAKVRE